MDRTLFSPAMIETYKACKKAYELAFLKPRGGGADKLKLSTVTKRLLLRAFADVNRGRIKTVAEAQRFIGQQWSALKINPDAPEDVHSQSIRAFRFAYRALNAYVNKPYRPAGAEVVGANLKLRARVAHTRAYIEDVFDLLLWHPDTKTIEIVDYQLSAIRPFDPAWPSPSALIKQFLAERIQSRYPFEKIKLTYGQILSSGVQYQSIELDEAVFRLHWPMLTSTIEEMKSASDFAPQPSDLCRRCEFSAVCPAARQAELKTCEERRDVVYRSA